MPQKDPSPQTTLVILLGASEWPLFPEFQSSKAFANAASQLKTYLLNQHQFGLSAENVLDLFDADQSADDLDSAICDFLEQRTIKMKASGNAARDLLVYYVGHGGFVGPQADYYLAIRRTRSDNPRASSIGIASLAYTLKEKARRLRRILILDCCFAAAAFQSFQSGPAQVAIQQAVDAFKEKGERGGYPERGTALLCSSGPKVPSLISRDGNQTIFTEALLQALTAGNPRQQNKSYLSLRELTILIADLLTDSPEKNAPRPHLLSPDQSEGDVADIPFFPNPAYQQGPDGRATTGTVILTHYLGRKFVSATNDNRAIHVLLEAKPRDMIAQARMPLNFSLVIDHTDTMKGAKLENVKEAIKMIIDRLEPTDYISLVIFSDTAQVIIPAMPANDKRRMKNAIEKISVANLASRTMSLGMIQGLSELRRWNIPNAVNRMILSTIGVTYGDADRCRQLARDAREAGISIYPLGIGQDWDESLLDTIGELSDGMPAEFIRNPADAMSVFEQKLQSAVAVEVRNATLTLHLPALVSPRKAVKVRPFVRDIDQSAVSDRQVVIPLGDLKKDTPQSVLVELMLDPRPPGLVRIALAELTYDVPIANIVGERLHSDVTVTFTTDANHAAQVNVEVMNIAENVNRITHWQASVQD